jgi:hypothetical protein
MRRVCQTTQGAATLAALVLLTARARADDAAPISVDPTGAELSTDAPWLGGPRERGASGGGVELAVIPYDDGLVPTTALRLDAFAEVAVRPRTSVIANVPAVRADGGSGSTVALGSLAVGVAHAVDLAARTRAVVAVSVSAALGGASRAVAAAIGARGRPADLVLGDTDMLALRARASVYSQRGPARLLGSLGVDLPAATQAVDLRAPIFCAAGGVATDVGPTQLGAEAVLLFSAQDSAASRAGTLGAVVAGRLGPARLAVGLAVPVRASERALVPVVLTLRGAL